MKRTLFFLSIFAVLFSCQNGTKGDAEITADEIREHIAFLASDSLKGRKPGTPEAHIAANYIAEKFKEYGLKPLNDNGLQKFKVVTKLRLGEKNALQFKDAPVQVKSNFIPFSFTANTELEAPVVFAGYGLDFEKDGKQWHDYNDLDVQKKWILILRADPEIDSLKSPFVQFSRDRNKVLLAEDKGVAGVLIVNGVKFSKKDNLDSLTFDKSMGVANIPVIQITRELADKMLASSKKTVEELENQMIESFSSISFEMNVSVKASTEVIQTKVETENVIWVLEGSDAKLKDEYLVIGGHYDHLGFGGVGSGSRQPDTVAVHNGADDNASGVAAVIELAQKFAANRDKIKRSIIFMSFGAEEMGLLGSKFFTKNAAIQLDKIKLMLNLDMVGRLDSAKTLTLGGTGTFAEFDSLFTAIGATNLNIKQSPEGYGPSDHASFYVENVPVLFFFTGIHPDYHTPADDTERINFAGEKMVTDLAYQLAMQVAGTSTKITFQEAGPKGTTRSRRFKISMGIMPDYAGSENNGLRVDGVTKGRPAKLAGMQKGDIIISIEGKSVKNIYDYMYRLGNFEVGQRISVEVLRNGEHKILIVEL